MCMGKGDNGRCCQVHSKLDPVLHIWDVVHSKFKRGASNRGTTASMMRPSARFIVRAGRGSGGWISAMRLNLGTYHSNP